MLSEFASATPCHIPRRIHTEAPGIFQAGYESNDLILHITRQAGGDAIAINLIRIQTFGFQENLMTQFFGESHDLVFNARTIARAGGGDLPAVHRRAMQICPDDFMDGRIGRPEPA